MPGRLLARALPKLWSNYGPVIVSEYAKTAFGSHPCRVVSVSYEQNLSRQRPRVRVPSSPPFKIRHLPIAPHLRVGTKRHRIGYTQLALSRRSLRFSLFLREQERSHRILGISFLSRNGLSVGIERHANRRVTEQFLHDFQLSAGGSKQRRISVTKSMPADSFRDS